MLSIEQLFRALLSFRTAPKPVEDALLLTFTAVFSVALPLTCATVAAALDIPDQEASPERRVMDSVRYAFRCGPKLGLAAEVALVHAPFAPPLLMILGLSYRTTRLLRRMEVAQQNSAASAALAHIARRMRAVGVACFVFATLLAASSVLLLPVLDTFAKGLLKWADCHRTGGFHTCLDLIARHGMPEDWTDEWQMDHYGEDVSWSESASRFPTPFEVCAFLSEEKKADELGSREYGQCDSLHTLDFVRDFELDETSLNELTAIETLDPWLLGLTLFTFGVGPFFFALAFLPRTARWLLSPCRMRGRSRRRSFGVGSAVVGVASTTMVTSVSDDHGSEK